MMEKVLAIAQSKACNSKVKRFLSTTKVDILSTVGFVPTRIIMFKNDSDIDYAKFLPLLFLF